MAPLPKRRLSRQRGRERLAGQVKVMKLTNTLTVCQNCKKEIVSHKACPYCGFYKGKKAVRV